MAGSTDRGRTPPPPPPPPAIHRGSGMKARLPEAAGGRPGHAGRSGPASFSGPSSRTKAEGAAGAGAPVSGALGAALLAAAALLLAPEAARAADECGAISSTAQSATCSATTYADGIIYRDAAPGANNVATVVVPGGSTAWTVTSGAGATFASNGITLDSDGAAGGGLALTVGGASATANRVAIRQRASNANSGSDNNNGILIIQDRTGASTTTVTVHAGVTIGQPAGTGAGRMNRHGILARVNAGSGAATFTNHAEIHSTMAGISVQRSPAADTAAATTIDNRGAISTGARGIHLVYQAGDATNNGAATIINSGDIASDDDAILLDYRGTGAAVITNRGAITATQTSSNGISLQHSGTAGGATVTNSGDIRSHAVAISVLTSGKTAIGSNAGASVIHSGGAIDVSNHAGILVTVGGEGETIANAGAAVITVTGGSVEARDEALFARNRQSGNVVIAVSEGVRLTSRTGHGIQGDMPASNVAGSVTINNAAAITAPQAGIYVPRVAPSGAGAISITNRGAIKKTGGLVNWAGIMVEDSGTGAVTVTNGGDIGEAGAMHQRGIYVQKRPGAASGDVSITTTGGSIVARIGIEVSDTADHTGDVTISNGGDVTAERPIRATRFGAGPVTVTNTGGTVRSESTHAVIVANRLGDASDVTVNVSGGTVRSPINAIQATNFGAGDVIVDVAAGATLISGSTGAAPIAGSIAAVYADLWRDLLASDNQVKIAQGGKIEGRTGVYARAGGSSVAETVEARAEGKPNVIDVTWTGAFSHGTADTVAQSDAGRYEAATAANLVNSALIIEAERATGGVYGSAAGIEAQVMSRNEVRAAVAASDDPGEIADAAAQTALLATSGAASRRTAILAQFRAALELTEINVAEAVLTAIDSTATTVADLSDEEIVTYLGTDDVPTRALLRNVLAQGLSDEEKAVLAAVATGGGKDDLEAALTAAGFTDDPADDEDYWSKVMALLDRYNPGNIRIAMNGGSIDSRGDGIRAYYTTAHDNNGAISVSVAEGATVTGANAGIYVANAGEGLMLAKKYTPGFAEGDGATADDLVAVTYGEGADAVALRNQLVTVAGTVSGGTDAAVHLSGGGAVLVLEGGEVRAGASGVGILVNDPGPALVYVDGEVRGAAGGAAAVHLTGGGSVTVGLNGRVRAGGAEYAIRSDGGAQTTLTLVIDRLIPYLEDVNAQVDGAIMGIENARLREHRNGVPTGYEYPGGLQVGDDGLLDSSELPNRPVFSCGMAGDGRCRMYEALPSMLLALNALPSWAERASAPRDANGAWARVEASGGEWRAKKAMTTGTLAYDHRWVVGRMGVDFTPREDLRVGWSVHVPRGKAEMAGVGEVELDGVGAGVSATWRDGDLYVDAQAAVTRYDVGFESNMHGELLDNDVSGVGYALGVEGGKRMAVGGTFVTPRAGLAWSDVDLGDFTDMETAGAPERRSRVSVQDARSVKGRAGVTVEKEMGMGAVPGLLFGSLDVEREFSDETEVQVGEQMLKTQVRPTAVSLGAGAVFDVRENVLLRAVAGYRTSGGGTSGYRGGLELQVRF